MSAVRNIAFKYLRFFSASRAVLAMTIISVVGIAIGVATLTVTLSVASGFGREYQRSILDFSAHVVLLSTNEIKDSKSVIKRLDDFKVTEEEALRWKDSELLISVLKPVEYLWLKLDQFYMDEEFDSWPKPLRHLVEMLDPKAVGEKAYQRGLYPKKLVEKIVDVLKLSQKGIRGVSPFIYREGLLIYNGQIRGIVVKGVEAGGLRSVSNMNVEGFGPKDDGLVIGAYLAKELGINVGDTVRLMLPRYSQTKKNEGFEEFKVSGTFESGMYDFDSQFALMNLPHAQKIFNAPDAINGIEIKLDDWKKSRHFARRLEMEFSYPLYATDWEEMNRSLFEAVKLEKLMFIIIMGALVIVAAFNIIGTVMLRILYKTSDIAILRALGMETKVVRRIFVIQGLSVGVFGTAIGMALALSLIWSMLKFGWVKIPPEIYLLKTLPVCISWTASVMIAAFSIGICWLTSVIASKKILDIPIVKGLSRP